MIRNPWPLKWRMPEGLQKDKWIGGVCPHNLRHNFFCIRNKDDKKAKMCKNCFIRQQYMSFYQMHRENVYIDRVCDRCGAQIDNPDTIMYLLLEGRKGEIICNIEICKSCAAELADWVGGIELPSTSDLMGDELDSSIWD